MLYSEFQCPTMPGTGLKVCVRVGGGVGVVVKTYNSVHLSFKLNNIPVWK